MRSVINSKLVRAAQSLAVMGVFTTFTCMDGIQFWDVPYLLALAAWLSFQELSAAGARVLEHYRGCLIRRQLAV